MVIPSWGAASRQKRGAFVRTGRAVTESHDPPLDGRDATPERLGQDGDSVLEAAGQRDITESLGFTKFFAFSIQSDVKVLLN